MSFKLNGQNFTELYCIYCSKFLRKNVIVSDIFVESTTYASHKAIYEVCVGMYGMGRRFSIFSPVLI